MSMLASQFAARKPLARRDYFLFTFLLLIIFAWAALWLWEQSPYGRYLNHAHWTEFGLAAGICKAIPAGEVLVPAFIYVGGWVLMTVAMMLPSTLPLLEIFRRVSSQREDRNLLLFLVIAGYLFAWTVFGSVAHIASWSILELVQDSQWLMRNPWAPAAVILLLAGAFQFTSLKYKCLDKCRTPMTFVMQYWRGRQQRRQSFVLGIHHGVYCVGCCWALMLLMFAVGTGSVGWMLLLGAVMALEKNAAWGRRLSVPLGTALLAWGGVLSGQGLA